MTTKLISPGFCRFSLLVILSLLGLGNPVRSQTPPGSDSDPHRPHLEWKYNDLFRFRTEANKPGAKVQTPADWRKKRLELQAQILTVLGPFPKSKCPLNAKIVEETRHDDVILRVVELNVEEDDRIRAYMAFPADLAPGKKLPTILALHGTNGGLGGISCWKFQDYPDHEVARIMAKRGFIVFAPDGITCGDHRRPGAGLLDSDPFYKEHPDWSILGKLTYDAMRCVDYLETVEMVDQRRIGAMGHSLGGYWTMFTAAFDERIAVASSSCGFVPFRADTNPGEFNLPCRWARKQGFSHAPALAQYWEKNIQPPFDFHELMALIAPRPFLNVSSTNDNGWPDDEAIPECCDLVQTAYKFLGAEERFHNHMYPGRHDQLEAKVIYGWMERWLTADLEKLGDAQPR